MITDIEHMVDEITPEQLDQHLADLRSRPYIPSSIPEDDRRGTQPQQAFEWDTTHKSPRDFVGRTLVLLRVAGTASRFPLQARAPRGGPPCLRSECPNYDVPGLGGHRSDMLGLRNERSASGPP